MRMASTERRHIHTGMPIKSVEMANLILAKERPCHGAVKSVCLHSELLAARCEERDCLHISPMRGVVRMSIAQAVDLCA